jgi:MCP family monocarboxylic acid transporter-like MFS transporter 10
MRILGFILLFALAIGNLTLKRRLPPKNIAGGLFNWRAFKIPEFSAYCLACFFAYYGLFTMMTYLDISAIRMGVSPNFSFYLLSILNSSSIFGRIFSGSMMDRYGCINTIGPATLITAVMTIAWPYATSLGGLIPITIIYGFMTGTFVAIFPAAMFDLGPIEDVGRRTGMAFTIAALGALAGPPTSGAINKATGGYQAVGGYAGGVLVLSVFFMYVTRYFVLGGKFVGKV